MELREECIGDVMTVRAANGYRSTVTIKDDKRLFKLYRVLGLDVFKEKKSKRESTKSNNK
jgi:hypothetical protein